MEDSGVCGRCGELGGEAGAEGERGVGTAPDDSERGGATGGEVVGEGGDPRGRGGGDGFEGGVAERFQDAADAVGVFREEEGNGFAEGREAVIVLLAVALDAVQEGRDIQQGSAGGDELQVWQRGSHQDGWPRIRGDWALGSEIWNLGRGARSCPG